MIGNDDNQEEVSFKVADRRKFNSDGSVKEGVVLEAAKVEEKPGRTNRGGDYDPDAHDLDENGREEAPLTGEPGEEDIPGADDPASFVNFLSTLATNAAAALGAVPHPATGKRTLDLETGKYWLDILGMLKDKTAGNLHPQESPPARRPACRSSFAVCSTRPRNRGKAKGPGRAEILRR